MKLLRASLIIPKGLESMLLELGNGENGFMGTSFGRGESTLTEFIQSCIDAEDPAKITNLIHVPMTTLWFIDDQDNAVGIVRVRHQLNERLLQHGGHIGYFIRKSERGKGYGKFALLFALCFLKTLGVTKALVTTDPENKPSIGVILANGGVFDGLGKDVETGETVNRYWIETARFTSANTSSSTP